DIMGRSMQIFAKGIQLNHDVSRANQNAAAQTAQAVQKRSDKLSHADMQASRLTGITERLEERDHAQKLEARVARIGVELAAAPAVYFTKQNLDTANVADAVQLIQLDDDAYWCGSARASIVQDRNGTQYCAISMPEYQPPEEQTAGE
ncbi:MAG: hypothetical protein AAGA94_10225, partial [Pseudomonadota bacterium]